MWDNQNNRHISSTYAISSADTWEKKTMTFAGDTGGSAFSAGTGSGIDCNWWLAAGSSFTSGSLASSWTSNTDANRAVGSNEVVKYSEKEEEIARAAVMEYETQQGDYNIFNDSAGGREFQTYLPYNAIKR